MFHGNLRGTCTTPILWHNMSTKPKQTLQIPYNYEREPCVTLHKADCHFQQKMVQMFWSITAKLDIFSLSTSVRLMEAIVFSLHFDGTEKKNTDSPHALTNGSLLRNVLFFFKLGGLVYCALHPHLTQVFIPLYQHLSPPLFCSILHQTRPVKSLKGFQSAQLRYY